MLSVHFSRAYVPCMALLSYVPCMASLAGYNSNIIRTLKFIEHFYISVFACVRACVRACVYKYAKACTYV